MEVVFFHNINGEIIRSMLVMHSKLLDGLNCESKVENNGRRRSWGKFLGNLTIGPSFGHNLCFKYSNGSCKPTLDIYILRTFQ
jgi:hypothetical protein